MFNKYYQEELEYLREMGAEFSRANPSAAPFLEERGADPDVERLLEGFAFLTGRLRQKLDDEFPELTQSLLQVLWPHYLRPVPAMSIVQFDPLANRAQPGQPIKRGAEIESVPVDGTSCRFRTCFDVNLALLSVRSADLEIPSGSVGALRMKLQPTAGAKGDSLGGAPLRLFLHGEPAATHALYLYLTRYVKQIVVSPQGGETRTLPPNALRGAGFGADECLLPYPVRSFPGYRLLQEYFALPEKFLFLELDGVNSGASSFELLFDFTRPADDSLRATADNFRLNCTPVVNLYSGESMPLRVDHRRVDYRVRPDGVDPEHSEIFSVDRAVGWEKGTSNQREFPAFESFHHGATETTEAGIIYYAVRLRESVLDNGVDTQVAFVSAGGESAMPPTETVVMNVTCTNRGLPAKLRVGDLSKPTASSPAFAQFKNITSVTPGTPPPTGPGLQWQLISNLALNYLSLTSADALKSVLSVYNFRALRDRQTARQHELRLAALQKLQTFPDESFYRGAPTRGTRVEIDLLEKNFAGEGEMVLFGSVLSEFLGLYCTLNSHTRLLIRGVENGEIFEWSSKVGQQPLL